MNAFSAFHRGLPEEGNLFKTIVWFNLPDLSQGLNKTVVIILSHLSHRSNHQLHWSGLSLPAQEEIHLGYSTHSQRKHNLEYPDSYFYVGHYTVLPCFLLNHHMLLFFIWMHSFPGSLGIAVTCNLWIPVQTSTFVCLSLTALVSHVCVPISPRLDPFSLCALELAHCWRQPLSLY